MAIVVRFKVSGMPVDKYEVVLRRLEAVGAGCPAGRIHHVSYGNRDALQVVDVFESREALDQFGARLLPILHELGITAEPDVQDAYKIIRGAQ